MTNEIPHDAEHAKQAASLLAETRAAGGLAPVDLDRFWADQAVAVKDPFGPDIPQVPFGASLTWECVFDELGIEEDHWRFLNDEEWRLSVSRRYNDLSEPVVGRRLLSEQPSNPALKWPQTKGLHDVFEARNIWHSNSWWLEQSAHDERELEALLDRVDRVDVRSFILPDNWEAEKKRLLAAGAKPPRLRGLRGPVTFAMSVYGVENLIFLIMDNPELAARFRDTIQRVIFEIADVLDEEAGGEPPRGFGVCDDNCAMLNAEMYEFFGYPILKAVFDRFCPDPADRRGQHSDSAMAHLLPVLSRLNFKDVNFGPNIPASEIRRHMPRTVIMGQLAPFTYSRNEEENIILEFLRDFAMTKDTRGLHFTTAGSINNGTRLTSMRLAMAAIQRYGRY